MTFKLDPALAPVTDTRFLVMDYDSPIGAKALKGLIKPYSFLCFENTNSSYFSKIHVFIKTLCSCIHGIWI